MTKAHHQVNVVRIREIRVHPNADKLEIVPIEGYQAVVGKGQFQVGSLAYYIPPDSVVPEDKVYEFLWKGPLDGPVPVKRRRIAAKRLRGEWSEGLLMPLNFAGTFSASTLLSGIDGVVHTVSEGDDVAKYLGIEHYDQPEDGEISGEKTASIRRKKWPTTYNGWVNYVKMLLRGERREGGPSDLPTYDVDAFKKYTKIFQDGEKVTVTEKIHGSNARYSYRAGPQWLGKYAGWAGHMYAGSRNLWKSVDSTCAWRRALKDNPWIEVWCKRHPGYALYGEIVPTQKGFRYGTTDGHVQFFLFDVRDPKGNWLSLMDIYNLNDVDFGRTKLLDDGSYLAYRYFVPQVYTGPFDLELIKTFVDGPSLVEGANHIREGIVIKAEPNRYVHNLGRVQLKIVSNEFLDKDSK